MGFKPSVSHTNREPQVQNALGESSFTWGAVAFRWCLSGSPDLDKILIGALKREKNGIFIHMHTWCFQVWISSCLFTELVSVCGQLKQWSEGEQVQSYLREQLIHSLLNQWIKIIHGVAGDAEKGVLAIPTLQIHNPVLNISCVNAQKNAKGDGRHWT